MADLYPAGERVTVLIVDDEPVLCELLVDVLASEHYEIVTVGSASSALTAINWFHPVLVLLDLRLPDMSGFTLCEQIRTNHGSLPIILTSCLPLMAWRAQAYTLGATAVLEKPYALRTIRAMVHRYLPHCRLGD